MDPHMYIKKIKQQQKIILPTSTEYPGDFTPDYNGPNFLIWFQCIHSFWKLNQSREEKEEKGEKSLSKSCQQCILVLEANSLIWHSPFWEDFYWVNFFHKLCLYRAPQFLVKEGRKEHALTLVRPQRTACSVKLTNLAHDQSVILTKVSCKARSLFLQLQLPSQSKSFFLNMAAKNMPNQLVLTILSLL